MLSRISITRLLFALLVLLIAAAPSPAQEPNANEILGKVAATYANCRSYYDEGSVSGAAYGFSNGYFRTTFVRPAHLAFEVWRSRDDRDRQPIWVVWKNGDSIKTWVPSSLRAASGARKDASLDTALDSLAGATAGASLYISPLLLPNLFRTTDLLTHISDLRVAGHEKIDGRETFRIEGRLWGDQEIKLWIDKVQYSILKTTRRIFVGGQRIESTVNFKPIVNADIPSERLRLSVPGDIAALFEPRSTVSAAAPPPKLSSSRGFGWSLTQGSHSKSVQKGAGEEDDVVRVDTDLVVASVMVLDADGKPVTGLGKEDFVVKEDDRPQEVAAFSMGDSKDVPRSIVLIIDYSGSQLPYIKTSIEAARMLVDKLNPKDRMAVVTDDVSLLVDFTSDKDLLKSRLDGLKQSALTGRLGASDQYDALMATLLELFDTEDIRPIVIFQTDGDQLEELKGGTPQSYNLYSLPRKHGLADILVATEKSRATVYSVISGVRFYGVPEAELLERAEADWVKRINASSSSSGRDNQPKLSDEFLRSQAKLWLRRHTALAALAKFTGAWTEALEEPGQANEIYNRILTDIDRRYVLGYYPTNRARDGKRRKVHIEIRNHPDYVVRGQKSYFAREEK